MFITFSSTPNWSYKPSNGRVISQPRTVSYTPTTKNTVGVKFGMDPNLAAAIYGATTGILTTGGIFSVVDKSKKAVDAANQFSQQYRQAKTLAKKLDVLRKAKCSDTPLVRLLSLAALINLKEVSHQEKLEWAEDLRHDQAVYVRILACEAIKDLEKEEPHQKG